MDTLNIALLQIAPGPTLEENLEKGLAACKKAKNLGADIALFPEMWSCGYQIYGRPVEDWTARAIPAGGGFVRAFQSLAGELSMAIALTLLEEHQGGPRNSLLLFDRFGALRLSYAKVHTCDFDVERHLTPGDGFHVAELDTAAGPVKVGAMICYDREFPESARILMLQGAELILTPNACPMEINRISQLRARAFENMLGIATVNYPEGKPDCNGHSTAFDGIAYWPGEEGARDTRILEADGSEGIFLADFPIEEMRRYRGSEVHGNAYRRPEKYGLLLSEEIREPFIRKDRREERAFEK